MWSEFILELLGLVPPIASTAALITALIALGKVIGLIKDGYAGYWSLGLNAVFWLGLGVARMAGAESQVSTILMALNEIAPIIMALVVSLGGSKLVHEVAKRAGANIKGRK